MELALYAPGLGYYAADREVFGAAGDYVTAPVIGDLLATCLAGQIAGVLHGGGTDSCPGPDGILEFGAGTGALIAGLLPALEAIDSLPAQYYILEPGPVLRVRQQDAIAELPSRLRDRVQWIDQLPGSFDGVMLANEVLDAMPVQRFRVDASGRPMLLGVAMNDDSLDWAIAPQGTAPLALPTDLALPPGYESEWSRLAPAWIRSVADCLDHGLVLLVDYGYDRRTYYHPDRSMGTLMCHYRHHAHGDPFLWPGLQDITAHVDFTAVANSATASGLDVLGYSDQAGFLIHAGLAEIHAERLEVLGVGTPAAMALAAETRRLTMPQEMGEQFKVLALGRGIDPPESFRRRNLASRLAA